MKIKLNAGYTYYLEALHKEDEGGDNLAIAWAIPGEGGSPVLIDGRYFSKDPPPESTSP